MVSGLVIFPPPAVSLRLFSHIWAGPLLFSFTHCSTPRFTHACVAQLSDVQSAHCKLPKLFLGNLCWYEVVEVLLSGLYLESCLFTNPILLNKLWHVNNADSLIANRTYHHSCGVFSASLFPNPTPAALPATIPKTHRPGLYTNPPMLLGPSCDAFLKRLRGFSASTRTPYSSPT